MNGMLNSVYIDKRNSGNDKLQLENISENILVNILI